MMYELSPFKCAIPCHVCDRPAPSIWNENPYPGSNLDTLYECKCGAVYSLADAAGMWLAPELPDHGRKAVRK